MPGISAKRSDKPSWPTSQSGVAMLADDAQPHDENRKLAKAPLRRERGLFTFLTHDGVDATNCGRSRRSAGGRERKVWGGNRTGGEPPPKQG